MAKICFYCGKELNTGEKCGCRSNFSQSSGAGQTAAQRGNNSENPRNDKEFKRKQKKFEQERRSREKQRAKKHRQNNRQVKGYTVLNFFYQFMTNQGFSKKDPFHKKLGYSFLHAFLRPVSAIDAFILNKDAGISIFYSFLFSISSGLLSIKLFGNGIVSFAEGFLITAVFIFILSGLFLLSFRFFSKIKYRFMDLLSVFSASFIFMSIFFVLAAFSGGTLIFSAATVITAISAGTLLNYLSLKRFSGLENDRLISNTIFVYFVFYSIVSFVMNLALV